MLDYFRQKKSDVIVVSASDGILRTDALIYEGDRLVKGLPGALTRDIIESNMNLPEFPNFFKPKGISETVGEALMNYNPRLYIPRGRGVRPLYEQFKKNAPEQDPRLHKGPGMIRLPFTQSI
jgi:hypothetical protein